jgi:zinc transporter ZupT
MNWAFLHRWYMPFAWITLAPLISVPIAVYLQQGLNMHPAEELGLAHGSSWVMRDDFLETIVVYVLNLGALVWLFNNNGSTRWAAFWASLVGLARIVAPIALASLSDIELAGNRHYIDWETLRVVVWFQDANLFLLGLMIWGAFARFVGETGGAAQTSYAHA